MRAARFAAGLFWLAAALASAATLTVTNTNDSGPGSLRQAIIASNASAGTKDTITFNIPGTGIHTITPLSQLPTITDPVVIDATTQPGYAGMPLVGLSGAALGGGSWGFFVTAGNTTIRGFVINGFSGGGIELSSGGGNVVAGNFIGTDSTGTKAAPNRDGLFVNTAGNNTIGGVTAADRNLISGNSNDGVFLAEVNSVIEGNFIGTDVTGKTAIANLFGIELGGSSNTVGGTSAGSGNVISGNTTEGIFLSNGCSGDVVEGNLIGTDVSGGAALPNRDSGIYINNCPNNVIGGTSASARNIISGNGNVGVLVLNSGATGNQIEGNFIGTDITGRVSLGQQTSSGITLDGAANSTIGGTAAGTGNVISGNSGSAVYLLDGASGNQIEGNLVGTDASGTAAVPNGSGSSSGVTGSIAVVGGSGNIIGGSSAAETNVISGNNDNGVLLRSEGSIVDSDNLVEGNFIGTDASGSAPLPNAGDGVRIVDASNETVGGASAGDGNVIAFNSSKGVVVAQVTGLPISDAIEGNSIYSNAGIGIDLGDDGVTPNHTGGLIANKPNGDENFPVLTAASYAGGMTSISGSFNSTANSTFRIEYFATPLCDPSGYGQGRTLLGSQVVSTDSSGNSSGSISITTPNTDQQFLTATATDSNGNTSEFSKCQIIGEYPLINVAGRKVRFRLGQPFTLVVASFTDTDPNSQVSQFSGTIGWGDGSTSLATVVSLGGGNYKVQGSHQYMVVAGYTITVNIVDSGGTSKTATSFATMLPLAQSH